MSADLLAILVRATLALSAAVLIVLALRAPLRAAFGAQIAYSFWLLAPIAVIASFLPARTIHLDAVTAASPQAAPVVETSAAAAPATQAAQSMLQSLDLAPWLIALWIAGVGFSVAAHLVSQRRFLRNADQAGPAVVGIVRPRIVLPRDFEQRFNAEERDLVLAHERAHLNAGDAQINALAALIQCLNWFNPLVHNARGALRIDQELACDARVMARHARSRRTYAEAMLKTQLSAHALPLGCQWPPVGAGPLKQRIGMLARPTPSSLQRAGGAAFCALTVVAVATVAWAAQPPRVAYASEDNARGNIVTNALDAQLVTAIQEGQLDSARELIEAGANVNYFLRGDGTPLTIASRRGNLEFAQYLIEHGADVNQRAPGDGNPLIMAAGNGHTELMALLMRSGADVNGYVRGDETPLIAAAQSNQLGAALYLIDNGADVNLEVDAAPMDTPRRRSPLGEARRFGHTEMERLLISRGARG